jgi:hypothetical protein
LERWAAKKGLKFKKDNSLFGGYFYNPTEDESDPGYGDSYAVDIIDKEYD